MNIDDIIAKAKEAGVVSYKLDINDFDKDE